MPYIVNFTDSENKTPITVFDNTSSQDTSLTFPGRNVTGYGQIIAENFLSVLENFASANAPVNPVEGQLWYDTQNGVLQLFDNTAWKAASNIQKSVTEPSVENSKVGELWVDTTNQQLRIYTGTRWLLVGPAESSIDGLRYGPAVENIADSDNQTKSILILYIADQPVAIVSKDSFTPKVNIKGFATIKAGLNVATPANDTEKTEFASIFLGGELPKLIGTAKNADALNVGGVEVSAGKFLRSDILNTTDQGINVRNNAGLTIGVDGNFQVTTSSTAAKLYNSSAGSSVDLQVNRNGIPTTVLRVLDNKVGINIAAPDEALDVDGNIGLTGALKISSTAETTNLSTGSIVTTGGAAITKNLLIGGSANITGTITSSTAKPQLNDTYDLGEATTRWKTVYAKSIQADEIVGTINGNITGNANTATNLKTVTSFALTGDVVSPAIQFDGQVGSATKTFATTLTANIVKSRDEPAPNQSDKNDFVLVYRASAESGGATGLLKQTRDTFVGDLGIPLAGIIPYAGSQPPTGFLFCDGGEVEISKFRELFDTIGTTYNGTAPLNGVGTFRLPDLRGRFALGRHNMDNNINVPNSVGGFVDNGGGEPSPARVEGTEAQTLAGAAGASAVALTLGNLPDHEHDMTANGIQYSAVRVDSAINSPGTTGLGPTAPGQAQYLQQSGGIKKPSTDFTLGSLVGIMNPFLTINYIIRSGPPAFTTT
jgi:microcystin-dependent protein|tara:strand:- start:3575 stop:5716 length:2142 start_codon:yes stop_codon:yes gene_type:complete